MNLAPILTYITWGLIWDPQNKRGIPVLIKKSTNINCSRSKQKEEDILIAIYILTKKLRRSRNIKRLHNYIGWLTKMVWL